MRTTATEVLRHHIKSRHPPQTNHALGNRHMSLASRGTAEANNALAFGSPHEALPSPIRGSCPAANPRNGSIVPRAAGQRTLCCLLGRHLIPEGLHRISAALRPSDTAAYGRVDTARARVVAAPEPRRGGQRTGTRRAGARPLRGQWPGSAAGRGPENEADGGRWSRQPAEARRLHWVPAAAPAPFALAQA